MAPARQLLYPLLVLSAALLTLVATWLVSVARLARTRRAPVAATVRGRTVHRRSA